MSISKIYTKLIIEGNYYRIEEVSAKPKEHFAKATLSDINTVVQEGLTYAPTANDMWSRRSEDQRNRDLRARAKSIKEGYLKKTSHLGSIKRFFWSVSKKEAEIESLSNKLLSSSSFLPLPNEVTNLIGGYLPTKDVATWLLVNKKAHENAIYPLTQKARMYGYRGNNFEEAKTYLQNVFQSIKDFANSKRLPKKHIVYKNNGLFKTVDSQATLQKILQDVDGDKTELLDGLNEYILDTLRHGSHSKRQDLIYLINLLANANLSLETQLFQNASYLMNALMLAAAKGETPLVEGLIKVGGDVNLKTKYGKITALTLAARGQHADTVDALIKAGANIDIQDQLDWTPLHQALANKDTKTIEYLIAATPDVTLKDHWEETPLHLMLSNQEICEQSSKIFQELISLGADINSQNHSLFTPLHYAVQRGHVELTYQLIQAGADLNRQDSIRRTALHYAVQRGNVELAHQLIQAGADLNRQDSNGRTALHFAVIEENAEIVRMLLTKGADKNRADISGWAPIRYTFTRFSRCYKLLKD